MVIKNCILYTYIYLATSTYFSWVKTQLVSELEGSYNTADELQALF
jgi:hypothetical protein